MEKFVIKARPRPQDNPSGGGRWHNGFWGLRNKCLLILPGSPRQRGPSDRGRHVYLIWAIEIPRWAFQVAPSVSYWMVLLLLHAILHAHQTAELLSLTVTIPPTPFLQLHERTTAGSWGQGIPLYFLFVTTMKPRESRWSSGILAKLKDAFHLFKALIQTLWLEIRSGGWGMGGRMCVWGGLSMLPSACLTSKALGSSQNADCGFVEKKQLDCVESKCGVERSGSWLLDLLTGGGKPGLNLRTQTQPRRPRQTEVANSRKRRKHAGWPSLPGVRHAWETTTSLDVFLHRHRYCTPLCLFFFPVGGDVLEFMAHIQKPFSVEYFSLSVNSNGRNIAGTKRRESYVTAYYRNWRQTKKR